MKVFALTVLVAVGASGFSSNRNACPTLQDAVSAFESHFGTQVRKYNLHLTKLAFPQIPDGALDCLTGGDNCPWNSLEDFGADFESATGIEIPEPDQDFLDMMEACVTMGEGCPSMEDVLNFVQEEFGINPSDETIAMIEMCAADFLGQLGFNGIGM